MHRTRRAAVLTLAGLLVLMPAAAQQPGPESDQAAVTAQAAVRPTVAEVAEVLVPVVEGAQPGPVAVSAQVQQEWDDDFLGPAATRALVVRDVLTGATLLDLGGDRPLVPASTVKLLTAAAVLTTMDAGGTLTTRVVAGPRPGQVVLVAGGDLLLGAGAGDPDAVAGRAGLTDLAAQTAEALATGDATPVRVLIDTTYADGPSTAPGWTDYWVDNGFAGRISMLGLQGDRALPFAPSPQDPAVVAGEAFRVALAGAGVAVTDQPVVRTEAVDPDAVPALAQVESAPVRDVLALALATSDNALVEQLARQAAVRDGIPTDQSAVNAWVLSQLADVYGIDVSDTRLADTSGLSDGTAVPMRVVADVLVAGADGSHPDLQAVLRGLPVAGLDGTMYDRFLLDSGLDGRGVVRAKTGSLPGVTALAGTLVTDDHRLLAFALSATDVGDSAGAIEARALVDALVADLVACGC